MSSPRRTRPRSRDRHGRRLRAELFRAPVPAARTRSERFARIAGDVMDRVRRRAPEELAGVVLAVDTAPLASALDSLGTVELGRVYPASPERPATIVVHRMPLVTRATSLADLRDLLGEVIAEQAALLLGRDIEDLLP